MNWYIEVLKKYAVFSGRARREEFWFFVLFNMIASIVLVIIDVVIGTFNQETGVGVLGSIYSLGVFIPYLAVTVRRLHDTNRTGWWVLMPAISIIAAGILAALLAPMLSNAESGTDTASNIIALLVGLAVLASGITIFVFLVLDGTVGANKYGDNPKSKGNVHLYQEPMQNLHQKTSINTPKSNSKSVTLLGMGTNVPSAVLTSGREVIVGRSPSANIQIDNKYVSSKHLALKLDNNGRVKVRDMASSNGTYIDGRKLDSNIFYELKKGEKLLVGSEDVVYTL